MEFKYMQIGNDFYGNRSKFAAGAEPPRKINDFKELTRRLTLKAEGKEINHDIEEDAKAWKCSNYQAVMNGTRDTNINWTIHSAKGGVNMTMDN